MRCWPESQLGEPDDIKLRALAAGVKAGDRRALGQAITLVESNRNDHRLSAQALLHSLLPHAGHAIRVGISGAPGAGKSTFIEALGLQLTASGQKVAVLAVDPSSNRTGGSILGDKTRMEMLSRETNSFIRPSPSSGNLGGVALSTREAMLVCEAAGFDVVIVETVGVGQSEIEISDMVDTFLLLLSPGGGDELQGIKRGIVEVADLVVVNKADGGLFEQAKVMAGEYAAALRLIRPLNKSWAPKVLTCSSLKNDGISEVWKAVVEYREAVGNSGELNRKRGAQALHWMWNEINENLISALRGEPKVAALINSLENEVSKGQVAPSAAAQSVVEAFSHVNRR